MLRSLRLNPVRSNPRRRLRADARVRVDLYIQEGKDWSTGTPPGTVWGVVVFFDPAVDHHAGMLSREAVYHEAPTLAFYKKMVLGGLWARWESEDSWNAGEPGIIEFMAAGSGFGPDVLEASAALLERPLKPGNGWNPAIELFKRYGDAVPPREGIAFTEVCRDDARYEPGSAVIKFAASDAFNARSLSEGILPRYQRDNDRYQEDPTKLSADEGT